MSKNFDILKNVIKKTVELKYYGVMEENQTEVLKENKKEYEELEEKSIELYHTLMDNLPEELKDLVDEFDTLKNNMSILNQKFYFNQGVVAGLTDLKFLEETDSMILTIR